MFVLVGVVWLVLRLLKLPPQPLEQLDRRQIRGPVFYLSTITVLYALSGTSAVTHTMARLLAYSYRPFTMENLPPGRRAVVVLGSGSYVARDWAGTTFPLLDRASAERVIEAVRVFHLTDPDWIISSGGLIEHSSTTEPNGKTMSEGLVRLGVPASRVKVET